MSPATNRVKEDEKGVYGSKIGDEAALTHRTGRRRIFRSDMAEITCQPRIRRFYTKNDPGNELSRDPDRLQERPYRIHLPCTAGPSLH